MNKYYKFDPKLKKQNLSKWLSTHSRHRTNRIVAYILYALALVICIGCLGFVLLLSKDVDQSKVLTSAALGLSVGFIFVTSIQNATGVSISYMDR